MSAERDCGCDGCEEIRRRRDLERKIRETTTELMPKCEQHTRYKALVKPRVSCVRCWAIYIWKHSLGIR